MKKVQLEIMKPFITSKLNAMMPIEDEVITEYVFSQLEESQVRFIRLERMICIEVMLFVMF